MDAKTAIYTFLKDSGEAFSAVQISTQPGMPSRTYTAHLLAELTAEGKIEKIRKGKEISYRAFPYIYNKTFKAKHLHEDEVWAEIRSLSGFIEKLSEQTETSFQFAFTEILNNAIEHSKSGSIQILIDETKNDIAFTIRDFGIGAFNSLMTKKKYANELETIQELVKGKNTSDPVHHSGEGIFWTSKISDYFRLTSFGYSLIIDNRIEDYTIQKREEPLLGTEVYFQIEKQSKKSIRELFHSYSFDHDKLTLDTTTIPIKLYDLGDIWISRSQAKKVLNGLEKYKKIIFDFKDIDLIGQGFADEIFRVYQNEHPEIILEPINMAETVELLVNSARNNSYSAQ